MYSIFSDKAVGLESTIPVALKKTPQAVRMSHLITRRAPDSWIVEQAFIRDLSLSTLWPFSIKSIRQRNYDEAASQDFDDPTSG